MPNQLSYHLSAEHLRPAKGHIIHFLGYHLRPVLALAGRIVIPTIATSNICGVLGVDRRVLSFRSALSPAVIPRQR